MPNRHYEQGTRFEHKVIKALEEAGYVTIRAAGSKGAGKVDIVAVRPAVYVEKIIDNFEWVGDPETVVLQTAAHLWIQCKRTGTIAPGEWNQLRECARWAGAVPILAENGPAGRGVTFWRLDADAVPRKPRSRSLYDIRRSDTM